MDFTKNVDFSQATTNSNKNTSNSTKAINVEKPLDFTKGVVFSSPFSEIERNQTIRKIAQSPIYGDIEGLDLPSLQDEFRYENYKKALNQTWYEQLGNFANQAIVGEIVGGTLQGAGAIAELFSPGTGKGADDFRNFLTDWGTSLQEWTREVTPIHRENPYSTFDFGDFGWWAQNGVSVASSLSLLIPARGAMGLLGAAGKALRVEKALVKGLQASGRFKKLDVINESREILMKGEQLAANRLKYLAEVGGTASFMRHMENFREAGQVTADTYNESLDLLNGLDDKEFSKWKQNNQETIKQFIHDTGKDPNNKEALADYIASKAGWQTYKLNWSNLMFDILQVAPLFKGLTPATRGLQTSLATARTEAAAIGKTLTKGDKVLASLAPLGGVLKRQWTEGIEEMINGISTEEGMRLGRILSGQIKEDGSGITDRILRDYIQDPHIWEQGFWGVLGGVTFESASTAIQNKYNKFKSTNYESAKEKAINEIQHRNLILANFGAFNNEINNNRNIYDLDESGKPKEIKGTPEEIENIKNNLRSRLANEVGIELGLNASRAGNVHNLLDYLNSSELVKIVAEQNKLSEKEARKFTSDLANTVKKTEDAYVRHYTSLTSSNTPSFLHDIILPNNIRNENSIRILNEDLNTYLTDLTKKLNDTTFRAAHSEEHIANIEKFIYFKAAESIKSQIEELIKQTKDSTQKRIYEKSLETILPTLDNYLKDKPTISSVDFLNSGIDATSIKDAAKILSLNFYIAKNKGEINDRTYNPEYAKEVLQKFKEAKTTQDEATKTEFNTKISKLNLKREWAEIENDFNELKKELVKKYPDEKSTPIDFKKELEILKKKVENIKNGTVAEEQSKVEEEVNKTIEQEELENLGVDFTKPESSDLLFALNMFGSEDMSNQEKINFINKGNIESNIEKLPQEVQDKVLNYFISKAELLQTLEDNKVDSSVIETTESENEGTTNPDAIVDDNTIQLEELSFNSDNDSQINLFLDAMKDINSLRNNKGNIQVSEEIAKKIVEILSLRQGVELVLRVDADNEQYSSNKNSIINAPIGLFTTDGKPLGIFLNKLPYLTNEIQLLNNVKKLSEDDLQKLIDLSRDKNKRKEYIEFLTNYVIKSINIESHGGIQNVANHIYKVVNFEATEDLNRIKSLISNWQHKIVRDYKANYAIRNKIKARKTFSYNVNVTKKTSGDLVVGRNENKEIVFSSLTDIYGEDVQLLVAENQFELTSENEERETIKKASNLIGKLYKGAVYVKVREHGHSVIVAMLQNTIGGKKQNVHNEAISNYVSDKVLQIAKALQNDDIELAKSIKNDLDKYTFTDRDNSDSYNYFSWGKSDKGYYLNFNTTKGKHKLVIGNGVIYIHSDGKQIGEIFTGEGKETTPTSKKGKTELKNILNNRLRNINIKKIIIPFDVSEEFLEYYDEATDKTYPSYKAFLLETDTLVTHYNHIVTPSGKHVSFFTNKAENNSTNFRTSRPLIINVSAVDNQNQDLSILNISENDFKEEDNVKTKIEAVTSLPMLYSVLGLDSNLLFVGELARDLNVTFDNQIKPNPENAPNANGMYFKGVVSLFENFLNKDKTKNQRQVTLVHETLHGIIDKSIERLSPNEQKIFRRKLKFFTQDLLEKTYDKSDDLNSILNSSDKNGVPNFTESQKQYVVEVLNLLNKFRENPTANLRLYDEIVTYTFSSPVFAKFMDSVESNLTLEEIQQDINRKTFWGKLKDILLSVVSSAIKLINGKVTKLTELENLLNTLPIFADNQEINDAITEQGKVKTQEKIKQEQKQEEKTKKETEQETPLITDKKGQIKLFEEITAPNINNTLDEKIISFLSKLNFTIEDYNSLKDLTGYDAFGVVNLLTKSIYIKEGQDLTLNLSKSAAYVAYALLGTKNKIRTDIYHSIDQIDNYESIFESYKAKSPNLPDSKIKELIIIDFLADAIQNNWEVPKDSYLHRKAEYWQIKGSNPFIKKIKYILSKLKRAFFDTFNLNKLTKQELTNIVDDLANDIITNNTYKYFNNINNNEKLVRYEETLERDIEAKKIIENLQNIGITLTGSLALREQGTLYRIEDENIHDLDFSINLHSEIDEILEEGIEINEVDFQAKLDELNLEETKLTKEQLKYVYKNVVLSNLENLAFGQDLPVIKKIKKVYPNFKIINIFSALNKNELTITGEINGYSIDLFLVNNVEKTSKNLQSWQTIFQAKLRMGRMKDIKDFIYYQLYTPSTTPTIKGFRYFNFNNLNPYTTLKVIDDNYNNIIELLQQNKTIEKNCP